MTKRKKQAYDIMSQIEFLKGHKGPMSGLFSVLDTGGRAEITGKDFGPSHGHKPLKSVQLMYGKKLIMSGKNKGKII